MRGCLLAALLGGGVWLYGAAAHANDATPVGLKCLHRAYPKHICGTTLTHVLWCDGTTSVYDAPRASNRTFYQILEDPSLKDTMSIPYVMAHHGPRTPEVFEDPGRFRHTPLFMKLYGSSASEVRANTARVRWAPSGQRVRVHTHYDVHRRIERIGKRLMALPKKMHKHFRVTAGTFVWRNIKGTSRRSTHSYATSIDVGVKQSFYWDWTKPDEQGRYVYRNRMPLEVVRVFEDEGFIWGGRWYHFDTMHFEYRPELLCAAQ